MNAWIDWLNSESAALARLAWPMLWQSSVLIAGLLLLDRWLRPRISAMARYALLLLIPLKLLLPPTLALPTSPYYWLGRAVAPMPEAQVIPATTGINQTLPRAAASAISLRPAPKPKPSATALLALVWAAGVVALLSTLVRRARQVSQLIRNGAVAGPELETLLSECRRELGVRAPVSLRLTGAIKTPALCRLFRPVILVPARLACTLSTEQLRAVFLHELTHLQRRDVPVNYAQTLIQIVYWFHPLVWIANAAIRRVREEAVDELVMTSLGEQSDTYPETLVQVARDALATPRLALGLLGILESPGALRQRLERLSLRLPAGAGRANRWRHLALLLAMPILLPMAQGQRGAGQARQAPAGPANENGLVEIALQVVTVKSGATPLVLNGHQINFADDVLTLTADQAQLEDFLSRARTTPGIAVAGLPKVVTRFTGIARCNASNPGGDTLNFSSEVVPTVRGQTIELQVTGSWTVHGEVPQGTATPPSDAEARLKPNPRRTVYAVNAVGYINLRLEPARASLKPGQSAIICYSGTKSAPLGTRLIVVASATKVKAAKAGAPDLEARVFKIGTPNLADYIRSVWRHPVTLNERDGEKLLRLFLENRVHNGPDWDGMAIVPDPHTESVILLGTARQLNAASAAFDDGKTPSPNDRSRPQVRVVNVGTSDLRDFVESRWHPSVYTLAESGADLLHRMLTASSPDGPLLKDLRVSFDARTECVILAGTIEQVTIAERVINERLEAVPTVTTASFNGAQMRLPLQPFPEPPEVNSHLQRPLPPPVTATVVGQVRRQGFIPLPNKKSVTLLAAIEAAGGFTRDANQKKIHVIRGNSGDIVTFDLKEWKEQLNHAGLPMVHPGDVVDVPETLW
ncbi:MAG TPA: M56 family metallopeptidase [Verrucomicrobiae bacterium]|nr:M56 family metallopeptidase [Verrucomicrobiae bacterium]